MTLYVLSWNNGLEFDDACLTELGFYTTEAKRDAAEARYRLNMERWPFCGNNHGEFVRSTVTTDEDFYTEETQ